MKPKYSIAVVLISLIFGATASCGSADEAGEGTNDTAQATESTSGQDTGPEEEQPVVDPKDEQDPVSGPTRIVSLSPSATETLFALGAGDQIVAADAYSTYPPEAPTTDLSGFDPNVEAILGYEPDLVVIANDANELVAALDELKIPVHISPPPLTLEDGYGVIAELGSAVGRTEQADHLIAKLRSEIDEALALIPLQSSTGEPLRVYHELDETFYSASSFGFIGDVYTQMGLDNIADDADMGQTGFPQLTEEHIIQANPDLIIITDQVSYTSDDVAARPGWDQVSAVKSNSIITLDADIASRWGPRLPQLIASVAKGLAIASQSAD